MPEPASDETGGPWTFEGLAEADRATLERTLRAGSAPDPAELEGFIYRGWNHGWVTTLSGRKFRKGFRARDGQPHGYNERVRRDRSGPRGEWEPVLDGGEPARLGYYRVAPVADKPTGWVGDRYRNLRLLDYGVPMNRGGGALLRVIRDFVALPNPGDHGLVLGKAYLQLGHRRLTLFYSFFVLGRREPISDEPW